MKKGLCLLVFSALLLSSCGPTKVDFFDFKKEANEAGERAKTKTIKQKNINGEGIAIENNKNITFKLYEEYTLQLGMYVFNKSTAKYECSDPSFLPQIQGGIGYVTDTNAQAVTKIDGQEYTINPLGVISKEGSIFFNEYGFVSEISFTNDSTKINLKVDYIYA